MRFSSFAGAGSIAAMSPAADQLDAMPGPRIQVANRAGLFDALAAFRVFWLLIGNRPVMAALHCGGVSGW
jgi:hypothetical protein